VLSQILYYITKTSLPCQAPIRCPAKQYFAKPDMPSHGKLKHAALRLKPQFWQAAGGKPPFFLPKTPQNIYIHILRQIITEFSMQYKTRINV